MNKRQNFNPYLPSYEYIPDGEPHIFGERLYVYGSHDRFNGKDYCENNYVCWSAPLNDLSDWHFEGEIYNRMQHPHREERMLLFAPDVVRSRDGKYYLYYSMAHSSRISVAVCETPAGKYEYLGDVKAPDGRIYGIQAGDLFQFDPGVFKEDDGPVYLYSGFCPKKLTDEGGRRMAGAHVCRLEADMITMAVLPQVILPRDFACPPDAEFFEAPSMRKIGGKYYLIYSARINGLHYAVSDRPDEGFIYGGRLHSASDIGLRGYTDGQPAYPNGNTHGSLIALNGQLYIFDHRYSNNSSYCRQGVAERVFIDKNGLIQQAESTSCGLNDGPLQGNGIYPAYIACCLRNLQDGRYTDKEERSVHMPYITQEGEDREEGPGQYLAHIQDGTMAGYKYFDFHGSRSLKLTVRGKAEGVFYISTETDEADKQRKDYRMISKIRLELNSACWQEVIIPADVGWGVQPLYFFFEGSGLFDLKEFEIQK